MILVVLGLLVVAAVTSSDRTTSSHAFSLQNFTLFGLLGLMLTSLHFLDFCQVQAECKGKVFRGAILIYRGNYNSRGKWSYLCLQAYCILWYVLYKLCDSAEEYVAI